MAAPSAGEPESQSRPPPKLANAEVYLRLLRLFREAEALEGQAATVEGRTALATAAIVTRILASALFRILRSEDLVPEGEDREASWNFKSPSPAGRRQRQQTHKHRKTRR